MKRITFKYYDYISDDNKLQLKFVDDLTDPANAKSAILWFDFDDNSKGILLERSDVIPGYDLGDFGRIIWLALNLHNTGKIQQLSGTTIEINI